MNSAFKKQIIALAICTVGAAGTAPAWSAGGNAATAPQTTTPAGADTAQPIGSAAQRAEHRVRATQIIGENVTDAQGERLGEIKDLIVDVANERVQYAVLSVGGVLGIGDKLFAYPVRLLQWSPDRGQLTLNADKERLKAAPQFEGNRWPDWNDTRYRSEVDRYFGPTVAVQSMPNQRLVRASSLLDQDVNDRMGRDAGEVEDLVINLADASVHYAVIEFDESWSPDDKLLPVPLTALRYPTAAEKGRSTDPVLDIERNQLEMSRGFDDDHWPDLNASGYRVEVDGYLDKLRRSSTSAGQAGTSTATGQ